MWFVMCRSHRCFFQSHIESFALFTVFIACMNRMFAHCWYSWMRMLYMTVSSLETQFYCTVGHIQATWRVHTRCWCLHAHRSTNMWRTAEAEYLFHSISLCQRVLLRLMSAAPYGRMCPGIFITFSAKIHSHSHTESVERKQATMADEAGKHGVMLFNQCHDMLQWYCIFF